MKQEVVKFETVYPHTPERIWRALTDRNALAKWLLPNDFQPRLGHRFRFRGKPSARGKKETVRCEVIELEEARRLAYTWRADSDEMPSIVTWTLEPVENGTRVRLEHVGVEPLSDLGVRFSLSAQGTSRLFSRLSKALAIETVARFRVGSVRLADSPHLRPLSLDSLKGAVSSAPTTVGGRGETVKL